MDELPSLNFGSGRSPNVQLTLGTSDLERSSLDCKDHPLSKMDFGNLYHSRRNLQMIPSKAMAAVASSGIRNFRYSCQLTSARIDHPRVTYRTDLDECVALLVVQLNARDGFARHLDGETLLPHLRIEELCQRRLVAGQLDVADVETLALTHRVADAAHGSSGTGETGTADKAGRTGESWVTVHGRDGLTVGTGSRELACTSSARNGI